MTWKRVRRVGGRDGVVEVEAISGAVLGLPRSWYLVPESEAEACCRENDEKPEANPDNDAYTGFLLVPAEHVEEAHPQNAE